MQRRRLFGSENNLIDLLNPTRTQLAGDPDIQALDPVLAFEISRARQNFLLVPENLFRHLHSRRRRRIIRAACLEIFYDLPPPLRVRSTIEANRSAGISSVNGIPATLESRTTGTGNW